MSIGSYISREFTKLKKRHPRIRKLMPYGLVMLMFKSERYAKALSRKFTRVRKQSPFVNVYHCCTQKTGSVWLSSVFSDPVVYRYSGLHMFYYNRDLHSKMSDEGTRLPSGRMVSPMRISYDEFQEVRNINESSRVFFIVRDPRDLIVSWYHSTKALHLSDPKQTPKMASHREKLQELDEEQGLIYAIQFFKDTGRFDRLRSWANVAEETSVKIVKFEELTSLNALNCFVDLFDFLGFELPTAELERLVKAYSFEKLTGRKPGQIDEKSHLRGGSSGYWRNQFTPAVHEAFQQEAGDLLGLFDYE